MIAKYSPFAAESESEKPRPRRAERLVEVMGGLPDAGERGRMVSLDEGNHPSELGGRETSRRLDSVGADGAGPRKTVSRDASGPCILSVTPEGEGETVAVVLSLPPEGGESDSEGKARRVNLHLLVEQYAELGAEGLSVAPGAITQAQTDCLLEAGELCAAIRRGMGLLQYGDCSARKLIGKLTARGIPRDTAANASAYLVRKGLIREDDTARLRAAQSLRKGWGPRRIREDLQAQGFDTDAIDEVMGGLGDEDFSARCAAFIRKKYGAIPEDPADRKKMTAALVRQGYASDHIREAMRKIARGE